MRELLGQLCVTMTQARPLSDTPRKLASSSAHMSSDAPLIAPCCVLTARMTAQHQPLKILYKSNGSESFGLKKKYITYKSGKGTTYIVPPSPPTIRKTLECTLSTIEELSAHYIAWRTEDHLLPAATRARGSFCYTTVTRLLQEELVISITKKTSVH